MAQLHSLLTANHRPHAAVYADATERLAATGFVRALGGGIVAFATDDLYKKVLQLDDASEWILTAITPTWVQVSGAGSLANDSITNALLANMAQATIKGRASGAGTGDPTDLSATQATAILNVVVGDSGAGGTKGLVPAPGAGDAAAGKYFDAAGLFSVPPGTGLTTEQVQDLVAAMLVAGTNVTLTYNDGAGTLTIDSSAGGGSIAPLVIEDANTVAQRNGTTGQVLRVHGTYTGSTNFEAVRIEGSIAGNKVESEKGASGTIRTMMLGGSQIQLRTGTSSLSNNWDINSDSAGSFMPASDSLYDIGNNSKRVRNLFHLGMPTLVSSDFTKSANTTLSNITGLTRAVQLNKKYRFEAELHFTADATGGHKYAIVSSGGAASLIVYQITSIDNSTGTNVISSRQASSGGSAGQAGATAGYTRIVGYFQGPAGNLTVQFAQNAASGSSSILAGSTFSVEIIEN